MLWPYPRQDRNTYFVTNCLFWFCEVKLQCVYVQLEYTEFGYQRPEDYYYHVEAVIQEETGCDGGVLAAPWGAKEPTTVYIGDVNLCFQRATVLQSLAPILIKPEPN